MGCAVATCKGSQHVIHCDSAADMSHEEDTAAAAEAGAGPRRLALTDSGARACCGESDSDAVIHQHVEEGDNSGLDLEQEDDEAIEKEPSTSRTQLMAVESRHSFNSCCCSEKALSGTGRNRQAAANGGEATLKQRYSISRLVMDDEEAHTTAALKLRVLLQQLEKGETPSISTMKETITFAADVLSKMVPLGENSEKVAAEERDELLKVKDQHVRAWLSATFTKDSPASVTRITPIERFRAVANTIIIGQFFGSLQREPSVTDLKYPKGVNEVFQEQLDNWNFDVFKIETLCNKQPLRYIGQELFSKHDLFRTCNVSAKHLDSFLAKIEAGYGCHGNPYHNATHAADVAATTHYFLHSLGLKAYMTHLEVLAVLLSAIIHDVHHPGTTNAFQIAQKSEYAMLYNDRSVLENHHLYYTFMLIQDDESNVLSGLTSDDYSKVRKMMIDVVLATDMSTHFDQIKQLKLILSAPEAASQLLGSDRSKLLNFLVHMADISHPGKPWEHHVEWTDRLSEEFFKQGDEERRLGRKCSPLCDRYDANIPESQQGFIQFIVGPSYDMCGDMLELILSSPPTAPLPSPSTTITQQPCTEAAANGTSGGCSRKIRVWADYLAENKQNWKLESKPKEEEKALVPVVKKVKEEKSLEVTKVGEDKPPLSNGLTNLENSNDSVDPIDRRSSDNSVDSVDHIDRNDQVHENGVDDINHTDSNDAFGSGDEECLNRKNRLEERHTISTVQTLQIPGGSEVRTVQTVELRKITTNGAHHTNGFKNHSHEP